MVLCRGTVQGVLALGLTFIVPLSISKAAEQHIVPPSELHEQLASAAQARQRNLAQLDDFFSSPQAVKTMRAARINARQVRQAFAVLSDDELQGLAVRAQKAQADFAAGALSNEHLTYIIIALATAVVVILILKH